MALNDKQYLVLLAGCENEEEMEALNLKYSRKNKKRNNFKKSNISEDELLASNKRYKNNKRREKELL